MKLFAALFQFIGNKYAYVHKKCKPFERFEVFIVKVPNHLCTNAYKTLYIPLA